MEKQFPSIPILCFLFCFMTSSLQDLVSDNGINTFSPRFQWQICHYETLFSILYANETKELVASSQNMGSYRANCSIYYHFEINQLQFINSVQAHLQFRQTFLDPHLFLTLFLNSGENCNCLWKVDSLNENTFDTRAFEFLCPTNIPSIIHIPLNISVLGPSLDLKLYTSDLNCGSLFLQTDYSLKNSLVVFNGSNNETFPLSSTPPPLTTMSPQEPPLTSSPTFAGKNSSHENPIAWASIFCLVALFGTLTLCFFLYNKKRDVSHQKMKTFLIKTEEEEKGDVNL